MKYSSDFKRQARAALKNNWPMAILTGFLARLIGGGLVGGGYSSGSSGSNSESSNISIDQIMYKLESLEIWGFLSFVLVCLAIFAVIWLIITLFIGGAAKLGYATFNLNLIDYNKADVSDLFSQFHRFWDGFCMDFLRSLFIALWSILFIIPGVIKSYSYAMAPYIMVENPGMTATKSIDESRRIMNGNKWRLFCLDFSFIGWELLLSVPSVIAVSLLTNAILFGGNIISALIMIIPCSTIVFAGGLFLSPYKEASYAAFYRDITKLSPQVTSENQYPPVV